MIPGRHHRSELRIHLVWGAFWISVYLGLVLAPLFALLVACRACHSIEGEGNTRSLLDGVGSRLTEKEIRLWIVAPQQMDPAVMKCAHQLPAADLDALVAYLMAAKSPARPQ